MLKYMLDTHIVIDAIKCRPIDALDTFRKRCDMDTTVQVRQRGTLTLPASLRERYNIKPGDTFRIVDLDGILVLTPMVPMVPELAREIEHARIEAGLSVEDMLDSLRGQRSRYVQEMT